MSAIYPSNFESKIGFDQIRKMLSTNCLSDIGREKVDDISFLTDYETIEYQTELVVEFLNIVCEYDNFPTNHFYDLRKSIKKIRIVGAFFDVDELYRLRLSLETLRGIVNFFKSETGNKFPNLQELAGDIVVFTSTLKAIDGILTKHGKVKDNASVELHAIRNHIFSIQSSINKKMLSIVRHLQSEGIVDEDTAVAMRDGRPVIPVVSANKKKINGIIHDESATGKTAFIEPSEIVEMNNRLRELENAEMREIVKILIDFANCIRPDVDDLMATYEFMGEIDFIRAKALFAHQFDCIKPDIRNEPFFDWQQARHPLLMHALKKENREVVPLNMRIDEPNRILLISGPNAGGKSVCLKTVGIIQYMLQCGLLITLGEGSRTGIFHSLFIDIGDEQSLENDLSTYSSHLKNMKYFTSHCNENSLVLIDEFGTGTEPTLGGAIAEAVLNKMNRLKTYGIITTHYTNLKHFGASHKGIVNGAMLYDSNEMRPLFKLQIGKPGSSFAFEIARKIGLSEEILNEATEKLGVEHIDYDKNLQAIVRDKQYWEGKRRRINKEEEKLDLLSQEYINELGTTRDQRKIIIAQAKKEAAQILDNANKTVENTIREIRETQAAKEQTKHIRKKLIDHKIDLEKIDPEHEAKIEAKINKIQQKEKNRGKKKKAVSIPHAEPKIKLKKVFAPGDKIRLKVSGSVGEIIDIDKQKVIIALGHLMTTTTLDKIESLTNNEAKKQVKANRMQPKADSLQRTNKLMDIKVNFKPDIDVRGQRAEEALSNIQSFIDQSIMVGAKKVRILHGKGFGILKDVIRNYLKTEPMVIKVKDEHVQFGGAGITVVELD